MIGFPRDSLRIRLHFSSAILNCYEVVTVYERLNGPRTKLFARSKEQTYCRLAETV